jgi:hypothetical protein
MVSLIILFFPLLCVVVEMWGSFLDSAISLVDVVILVEVMLLFWSCLLDCGWIDYILVSENFAK